MVLAAVSQDGSALKYLSQELNGDTEFMLLVNECQASINLKVKGQARSLNLRFVAFYYTLVFLQIFCVACSIYSQFPSLHAASLNRMDLYFSRSRKRRPSRS